MYISELYREEDRVKIIEFLRKNKFAVLISCNEGIPVASHLLAEVMEDGENLFVIGHMSKANPLWKTFDANTKFWPFSTSTHVYVTDLVQPRQYAHMGLSVGAYLWNSACSDGT